MFFFSVLIPSLNPSEQSQPFIRKEFGFIFDKKCKKTLKTLKTLAPFNVPK